MSTEVLNNLSDHFDATLLYWVVYKMDATPEVKTLLVKLKLHWNGWHQNEMTKEMYRSSQALKQLCISIQVTLTQYLTNICRAHQYSTQFPIHHIYLCFPFVSSGFVPVCNKDMFLWELRIWLPPFNQTIWSLNPLMLKCKIKVREYYPCLFMFCEFVVFDNFFSRFSSICDRNLPW
jgi:hypothetical protein